MLSLSLQYHNPLMGWRLRQDYVTQNWPSCIHAPIRSLVALAVSRVFWWGQCGACFFGFRIGVRAFSSLFGWSCQSEHVKIKAPPALPRCIREGGEDSWLHVPYVMPRQVGCGSRAVHGEAAVLGTPSAPLATWTCSQGVQSLNLGIFQCFTWFKTKNLVEEHCSKRKIPSNKVV